MKYLLDTHTFLWSVCNTKALSKRARESIINPENEIYVSAVTLWEISIKTRVNKLSLAPLGTEDLIPAAEQMQFELIELTPAEAISYHHLAEKDHSDPFDRMLVWQAISRGMGLISKDRAFKKFVSTGLNLLW